MAAFHPSPWLIQNTNPLAAAGGSLATIKKTVRRQILNALPKGIVEKDTLKARRRHRSIAKVISSIEQFAGTADQSADGWKSAVGDDVAAKAAVNRWRHAGDRKRTRLNSSQQ